MTVIAMTREMGSLGKAVALGPSQDPGLSVVQHELVGRVAEKMRVREISVNRFLKGKASLLERRDINEKEPSLYTTEETLDIAAKGNVLIRGWGPRACFDTCRMSPASAFARRKSLGREL